MSACCLAVHFSARIRSYLREIWFVWYCAFVRYFQLLPQALLNFNTNSLSAICRDHSDGKTIQQHPLRSANQYPGHRVAPRCIQMCRLVIIKYLKRSDPEFGKIKPLAINSEMPQDEDWTGFSRDWRIFYILNSSLQCFQNRPRVEKFNLDKQPQTKRGDKRISCPLQ